MAKKKRQHGGKRKGSGRKPKYGEPTKIKTIAFPLSLIEWIGSQPGTFSEVVIDAVKDAKHRGAD